MSAIDDAIKGALVGAYGLSVAPATVDAFKRHLRAHGHVVVAAEPSSMNLLTLGLFAAQPVRDVTRAKLVDVYKATIGVLE